MAEVTRVPVKPTSTGSRVMLFTGIVLALLIAAAFAWYTAPKGVSVDEIRAGTGDSPTASDVVFVHYTGKLADGTVFDEGQATPLPLEGMIPGFREGALKMQKGGKYVVEIPSDMGYGDEEKVNPMTGEVAIPAGSDLVFEIEMLDFMPFEEFQQRMQAMQQMMQQQQGQGGQAMPGQPAPAQPIPMPPPPQPQQ